MIQTSAFCSCPFQRRIPAILWNSEMYSLCKASRKVSETQKARSPAMVIAATGAAATNTHNAAFTQSPALRNGNFPSRRPSRKRQSSHEPPSQAKA